MKFFFAVATIIAFSVWTYLEADVLPEDYEYETQKFKFSSKCNDKQDRNGKYWIKFNAIPPNYLEVNAGNKVVLDCQVIGFPSPRVRWLELKNDVGLGERHVSEGMAIMNSRLQFGCIKPEDAGLYTCTAESKGGIIQSGVFIDVNDDGNIDYWELCENADNKQPPSIVNWPTVALDYLGKDIELPCLAEGKPKPVTYWYNPIGQQLTTEAHGVSENGSLTVRLLEWTSMGQYTCVASNSLGSDSVAIVVYPFVKEP